MLQLLTRAAAGTADTLISEIKETLSQAIASHTNHGEFELDYMDAEMLLDDLKDIYKDTIPFNSLVSIDNETNELTILLNTTKQCCKKVHADLLKEA
jgi:hypothetical protein